MIKFSDSIILSTDKTDKKIINIINKYSKDYLSYSDSQDDDKLMGFLNSPKWFNKTKNILCLLVLALLGSCNKEYFSAGIEIYDSQFIDIQSISFPIYSFQKKNR